MRPSNSLPKEEHKQVWARISSRSRYCSTHIHGSHLLKEVVGGKKPRHSRVVPSKSGCNTDSPALRGRLFSETYPNLVQDLQSTHPC